MSNDRRPEPGAGRGCGVVSYEDFSGNEVRPCPFCGEPPHYIEDLVRNTKVSCGNDACDCVVETIWCNSRDEARNAWNKRAEVSP